MTAKQPQNGGKKDHIIPTGTDKDLYSRIVKAAKRHELSLAGWIRMTIVEKLEKLGL